MTRFALACACFTLVGMPFTVAQSVEQTGQIEQVIIYRGEAKVTRLVTFESPAGRIELSVPGLPPHTVSDSLSADGDQEISVRAVLLRTRAVQEEPREAVRKIDVELEKLAEERSRIAMELALVESRGRYLDQLETFSSQATKMELSKGSLDADALKSLTLFLFEQREKQGNLRLELQQNAKRIEQQIELQRRRRGELASKRTRTIRTAVLHLNKQKPGPGNIRLHYLVQNATWSPSYNVRGDANRTQVGLQYNALITQQTGEDWSGVQLTLSTASPRLRAQGPDLGPFSVSLTQEPGAIRAYTNLPKQELAGRLEQVQKMLNSAGRAQQRARGFQKTNDFNWQLNRWASEAGNFEINQANMKSFLSTDSLYEGLSMSYRVADSVHLASRTEQQMVEIASLQLPARFFHIASPVLSRYVYEHAEITNRSQIALLPGEFSAYLDGRFVGHGEFLEVAPGQEFTVGFGTAAGLRTRRVLVDRKEEVRGGNKKTTFTYRLFLENYQKHTVEVRLQDRIAHPTDGQDIQVTMAPPKTPLSQDALYLRDERPEGLLRWDVTVPSNAFGEKTYVLKYGYSLEFDRNRAVMSPIHQAQEEGQMREQFQELQKKRYRR